MTPMTPELRQAVRDAGNDPVWLKDTESNADYVLIRAELFTNTKLRRWLKGATSHAPQKAARICRSFCDPDHP